MNLLPIVVLVASTWSIHSCHIFVASLEQELRSVFLPVLCSLTLLGSEPVHLNRSVPGGSVSLCQWETLIQSSECYRWLLCLQLQYLYIQDRMRCFCSSSDPLMYIYICRYTFQHKWYQNCVWCHESVQNYNSQLAATPILNFRYMKNRTKDFGVPDSSTAVLISILWPPHTGSGHWVMVGNRPSGCDQAETHTPVNRQHSSSTVGCLMWWCDDLQSLTLTWRYVPPCRHSGRSW